MRYYNYGRSRAWPGWHGRCWNIQKIYIVKKVCDNINMDEKEQMERLKNKAKKGLLMLDE